MVAAAKDADVVPAPKLSLWERMIVGVLPVVPRWGVKRVAQRYVAGESLSQAMSTVETLNAEGALATVPTLVQSYGELTPVGCNDTPQGRELNRRVEVWVRDKRG